MVTEIPVGLPADVVPFAWLLGAWEGSGVLDYVDGEHHYSAEFGQRLVFTAAGDVAVKYEATAWLQDDEGEKVSDLLSEVGYWRLSRPVAESDLGPGLLPVRSAGDARTADDVESLRADSGGFGIDVSIVRSDGTLELYIGEINGPRIEIGTDALVRVPGAKEYAAATRMYGLVQNHLLWAWDIAAFGNDLKSHASARLAPVATEDSWVAPSEPESAVSDATSAEPAASTEPQISDRAKVAAAKAKAKKAAARSKQTGDSA